MLSGRIVSTTLIRGISMRTGLTALFVLTGLVQGCEPIPVYTTTDKAGDKAGLGFFPIIAMDQSKHVYEQTWYELTVTRTLVQAGVSGEVGPSDKTKTEKSKTDKGTKSEEPTYVQKVVGYTNDPSVAANVYRAFSAWETPQDAWAHVKDAFVKKNTLPGAAPPTAPSGTLPLLDAQPPDPFDLVTPSGGQDLAGLVHARKFFLASVEHTQVQAPGRKVQYLNIQTPHGGTSQGSIQINQDGTLANASGQIQDTMPGKWVDAFSAITSAGLNAIGSVFKAAAENRPGEKAAQLDVKRVSRTYTIIIQRPIEKSETDCGGLEKMLQGAGDAACRAGLVVALAPDQSSGDKEKKKDKADAKDTKDDKKKDTDK